MCVASDQEAFISTQLRKVNMNNWLRIRHMDIEVDQGVIDLT